MTIGQCAILFIIIGFLNIGLYAYLYHVKKQEVLAIAIAVILMILLLLSIIFVLPFPHRSHIIESEVSQMRIEQRGVNYYAICEDGNEYKIKSTNTMLTSGFNSYKNDEYYSNVKVEVTYRYEYKIWWIIPAYDTKHDTDIYFDEEWFRNFYGCGLDYNPRNVMN